MGIDSTKLDFGLLLRFPLELSDLQTRRIVAMYETQGWKTERTSSLVLLRKGPSKIEIGKRQAVVVAEEPDLTRIKSSIEGIYRDTLDRALVFQLAATESASSALYNRLRRKFRSSVTDCYYSCFNALRAGMALTIGEEEAERLEHPGLKTPDAEPPECEWNLGKRTKWVAAVDSVIKLLGDPKNDSEVTREAKRELELLVSWAKPVFNYPVKGDRDVGYDKTIKAASADSIVLERFLAERVYWLRIRADYRVDFETTISTSMITEALYGAFVFTNAVTSLVKKELAFSRLVRESDPLYRSEAVQGQIIDLGYAPGRIARALLLSEIVNWTADEAFPNRRFIGRVKGDKLVGRMGYRFARIRRRLAEAESEHLEALDEEGSGVVEATMTKEGGFGLEASGIFASSDLLPLILFDLIEAIQTTHPGAFVVIQGNRRVVGEAGFRGQRRLDEFAQLYRQVRNAWLHPLSEEKAPQPAE